MICRRNTCRKLRRDEDGVAMIEFAFVFPILTLMIFGGLELTNLAVSQIRVGQIAMTVADNAGRVTTSMDEADVYEVFEGADSIGDPMDFEANGRVVLSSLEDNQRSGQWLRWQRCHGEMSVGSAYAHEGQGENDNSLRDGLGEVGNKITARDRVPIMFVEVTYQYQPLVGEGWFEPPELRAESAFAVRSRGTGDISNTQNLAVKRC